MMSGNPGFTERFKTTVQVVFILKRHKTSLVKDKGIHYSKKRKPCTFVLHLYIDINHHGRNISHIIPVIW